MAVQPEHDPGPTGVHFAHGARPPFDQVVPSMHAAGRTGGAFITVDSPINTGPPYAPAQRARKVTSEVTSAGDVQAKSLVSAFPETSVSVDPPQTTPAPRAVYLKSDGSLAVMVILGCGGGG